MSSDPTFKPLTEQEREWAAMCDMDETEYALLKDIRNLDDWNAYVEAKAERDE